MPSEDVIAKLDRLLNKQMSIYQLAELASLKNKAHHSALSENEQAHILDLWQKFGSKPEHVSSSGSSRNDLQNLDLRRPHPPKEKSRIEKELDDALDVIQTLRQKGKRAVADRDKWEARAAHLEKQVSDIQKDNTKDETDRKFEEAKRVFAKLYHPNSLASASSLETMIRAEFFKEFWAELERISSSK